MKRYAISLVIIGIVTSLVASICLWLFSDFGYLFTSNLEATNFYTLLDSLSKFAVVLAFYISLTERDILKQLVFLVLLYGFGQLLDELFFNPSKMQLNEVILIIVALIYVIYGRKTLSIK
jgi:hypothetical protein